MIVFFPAFWPLSAMGPMEWAIIGIVAVVLFGRRLPQLGRSLGRGLVEFKRGVRSMQDEIKTASEEAEPSQEPVPLLDASPAAEDTGTNTSGTDNESSASSTRDERPEGTGDKSSGA